MTLPLVLALLAAAAPPRPAPREGRLPVLEHAPQTPAQKAIDEASCSGEYADAILALSPRARELERLPEANYSYCVRNAGTYECLYYGAGGRVQRRNVGVVAHGTAFAFRERKGEYHLLTNEHVATWPAVTDEDHEVSGVPPGCKKVGEALHLVRGETDDYEPGFIPVTLAASAPSLDAAVLRTRTKLAVMPHRLGRSALLRSGNVVVVRGFPLGLLQATNWGKVVTALDHDREKGWDHQDFVTDALVTRGNSGSPVLAVSCRTGELELVGLYHAGYHDSPALNAAVGVDELREFMDTLRHTPRPAADPPLGPEARGAMVGALTAPGFVPFFKVGDRLARARIDPANDLVFDIFTDAFPARDAVAVSLRDGPGDGAGELTGLGVLDGARDRLRWVAPAAADAESQDLARRLLDVARRQLLRTIAYREAALAAAASRESSRRASDLARQLEAGRGEANELVRALSDVASRLPPPEAAPALSVGQAAPPSAVPGAPVPTLPPGPAPGSRGR